MSVYQLNPLKVECTLFFQENPYTYETADGLAVRLGRKGADLITILDQLASVCILEKLGEGEQAIYRYIQPDDYEIQREITWE